MLGHSGAGKSGTDERNGVNGMKADFRKTMEALDSVSTEKLLSCAHSCPPPDRRKIVRVIKDFQAAEHIRRFFHYGHIACAAHNNSNLWHVMFLTLF